jgi:hypothetical protein
MKAGSLVPPTNARSRIGNAEHAAVVTAAAIAFAIAMFISVVVPEALEIASMNANSAQRFLERLSEPTPNGIRFR